MQRLKDSISVEIAIKDPNLGAISSPDDGAIDSEGLEFRLFAKPSHQPKTALSQPIQRVRVHSPSADPTTAGFLQPEKSRHHYFASLPDEAAKSRLGAAAVTSAQVHALSVSIWPGSTYEWKVQHINAHGYSTSAKPAIRTANPDITAARPTKHCKLSKAARVRQRVRLGKLKAARHAAENAGAAEREKKSARNREKKLKKKAREKAKKAAGGLANAADGEAISSADSDDG
ncbi:hypothetical protein LTR95_018182 [Oleoguttula sp. CCFEE 5521]